MSPYRPTNQRRRSHSVSPSTFHDQHAIDSCLLPIKRTHSRKDKWDLDSWRRGKRPRTQRFSPPTTPNDNEAPAAIVDCTTSPRFPSTSTAFDLRPRNPPPSCSQHRRRPDSRPVIPAQDISALHSSAFWELHQSIIEASEGFVQRMRDWESSRPQGSRQPYRHNTPFPSYAAPRGREPAPRNFSSSEATSGDDDLDFDNDDDDDDDVLILSDEPSYEARAASFGAVSPPKKRARSLGDMDLDSPQAAILPELSHTVASSSTSSLLSLSPPVILPPSTREEKAIAALTLALANGAAGINDYSAVREALGASAALAEGASEVGEMWR